LKLMLADEFGRDRTGSYRFERLKPAIGATYKLSSGFTAFAEDGQSNDISFVAEILCACLKQKRFLTRLIVARSALNHVVRRAYQGGLRGGCGIGRKSELQSAVGIPRTDARKDVFEEASQGVVPRCLQNDGNTPKAVLEPSVDLRSGPWRAFAGYSYVQAASQSHFPVNGPFNSTAGPSGQLQVQRGKFLTDVPRRRFKGGTVLWATRHGSVPTSRSLVTGEDLRGIGSNQDPGSRGYGLLGVHSDSRLNERFKLFGNTDNFFRRHYYDASETFINISGLPLKKSGKAVRSMSPAGSRWGWDSALSFERGEVRVPYLGRHGRWTTRNSSATLLSI